MLTIDPWKTKNGRQLKLVRLPGVVDPKAEAVQPSGDCVSNRPAAYATWTTRPPSLATAKLE
jgi:hypothetical protein